MYSSIGSMILASGSPRRRELLEMMGLRFKVDVAEIDESPLQMEPVEELVSRLANEKAEVVAKRNPDATIIAADTLVAHNSFALGKPQNEQQAFEMLLKLSGSTHTVLGGISVLNLSKSYCWSKVSTTRVTFVSLDEEQIRAYIRTGEPMDKAGAYGIQGLGAQFVSKIEGSYFNVVGLDLCPLMQELGRAGCIYLD